MAAIVSGSETQARATPDHLAHVMYDELDAGDKQRYTLAYIAAEFSVTRLTIDHHLQRLADES